MASLFLPCGRCVGCRLERARQWSVRIMHEASLYEASSFVTLTYDEFHIPPGGALRYRDFQSFMKRLRNEVGPTRFFMCGEYGEKLSRPHYHVGLFGVDFRADRRPWRCTGAGFRLFRSPTLERLWFHGNSEIGELTRESAAYMARYTFKKVNGDLAESHYRVVDTDTGEVTVKPPEFARMSLKPGIGARWLELYGQGVADFDRVVVAGHEAKPPRYYDQLLKRRDPERFEEIQFARAKAASLGASDNSDERLAVREAVATARTRFYKRK